MLLYKQTQAPFLAMLKQSMRCHYDSITPSSYPCGNMYVCLIPRLAR